MPDKDVEHEVDEVQQLEEAEEKIHEAKTDAIQHVEGTRLLWFVSKLFFCFCSYAVMARRKVSWGEKIRFLPQECVVRPGEW